MKRSNDEYIVGQEVILDDGSRALLPGIVLATPSGVPFNPAGPDTIASKNNYTIFGPAGTLGASATAAAVGSIVGGRYIFSWQMGGTTPQFILETIGADGATYVPVIATVTAANGQTELVIGNNSTLRVRNLTANAITAFSATLAQVS
jgi:hypothetical protein